ncbi:MAG TPA: type II secretion system protein [Phycisphaerae bacterium]|nr:type II secretion system protein [Phycisphaerae bacterium]
MRPLGAISRGRSGGFTLFEVVLSLLIIGIAAAMVIPAATNASSSRLRTAANILAGDVDFCSSECISQPNAPRAISFDAAHNKYTVIDFNAGTTIKFPGDGQNYVNDFSTGRNSQLSGVRITSITMGGSTLSTLTFDAYGKPLITADLAITLTYNGTNMTVTVKNTTGDVTITGG